MINYQSFIGYKAEKLRPIPKMWWDKRGRKRTRSAYTGLVRGRFSLYRNGILLKDLKSVDYLRWLVKMMDKKGLVIKHSYSGKVVAIEN